MKISITCRRIIGKRKRMPVSYGPVFITVIHGIITQNYRESKKLKEILKKKNIE